MKSADPTQRGMGLLASSLRKTGKSGWHIFLLNNNFPPRYHLITFPLMGDNVTLPLNDLYAITVSF